MASILQFCEHVVIYVQEFVFNNNLITEYVLCYCECQTSRPNDTLAHGHLGPMRPWPRQVGPEFETPWLM